MIAHHNVRKKKGNNENIIEDVVLDAGKKVSKIMVTNGNKIKGHDLWF